MIRYRWQALPFRIGPYNNKIHGYDLSEFSGFLDILFAIADLGNGFNARFVKPANLFVTEEDGILIIGFNYSKAIIGMCSINETFGDEKQMKATAEKMLGMRIETTIRIPKKIVDKYQELFNSVILDRQNTSDSEYLQQLQNLAKNKELAKLSKMLNNEIVNFNGSSYMFVDPIFHSRDISVDPDLCFLVMPFNQKRKEVLERVVKPRIEDKFKLNVLKSGDIQGANQNIMENIWTYINQASVIVADMSDGNPNVFYELGICHTLGKPVILLCDEESKEKDYNGSLPFDLSGLQVIFYSNTGYGPTQLANDVVESISNLRKQIHKNN